jgi:hypothetical protein
MKMKTLPTLIITLDPELSELKVKALIELLTRKEGVLGVFADSMTIHEHQIRKNVLANMRRIHLNSIHP